MALSQYAKLLLLPMLIGSATSVSADCYYYTKEQYEGFKSIRENQKMVNHLDMFVRSGNLDGPTTIGSLRRIARITYERNPQFDVVNVTALKEESVPHSANSEQVAFLRYSPRHLNVSAQSSTWQGADFSAGYLEVNDANISDYPENTACKMK